MASKIITKGLKRTALSVALGMCFAGSVYAQSNSTGTIAGTTTAGGTVVIENPATGFRREVTADADGNYRVGSLPTGTYKVTAGGQTRDGPGHHRRHGAGHHDPRPSSGPGQPSSTRSTSRRSSRPRS